MRHKADLPLRRDNVRLKRFRRSVTRVQEAAIQGDRQARRIVTTAHCVAALALALAIFALDVISPLQGAVAVLYTIVVLIAARPGQRRLVFAAGTVSAGLAMVGYVISHGNAPLGSPAIRLGVSLLAICVTSLLSASQITQAAQRRRADARYAAILNASGFPIWESDWSQAYRMLKGGAAPTAELAREAAASAFVRHANQQAARLFGYDNSADMIGVNILHLHTDSGRATQARIFERLMAGESPVEAEAQFTRLGGELIDVVLRVSRPPDDEGWRHVLITAMDVTERNRAQAALAETHAELIHMARVMTLGQIAASIAHEVNQPLSAIITYAKSGRRWLAREVPQVAEVKDCLDQIAANGARAAEVIARIRDLARNTEPVHAVIALESILADTLLLLQRDLSAAGVEMVVALPPDLPEVCADRVQLQQVLLNLILNAQQAMTATPAPNRAIRITAAADAGFVKVAVSDAGTGLAGADPETLFRPFFTTKAEGMGMGLTICRNIMEQHGGSLHAAANPLGGLTMHLRLPIAQTGACG